MIRWALWVAVLTTGALAAPPKPPAAGAKSPNIILITLDTTRADRMGFLGSKRGLTPNLDVLASQSVVFTRAYSQVPLTPPSHATILTGTYPQFHQINDFQTPLAPDLPFAPDILHAHGYHTAAFVGSIVLQPDLSYAMGFDRGFDTYDAGFHEEGPGEDRYSTVQRRGTEVVAHALAWLNKHAKGPVFIWVHLYDAHDPYEPPEPYKTRYKSAPYDGAIAYEDAAIGKFIRQLKLRGLYENSVIAVMADHGESLGAHGEDTHGVFLYDETIHVPLLIKLPHAAVEQKIDARVELLDVAPTLLEAAGVAIPAQMQGKSLLGLMKTPTTADPSAAEDWRRRPVYSQSEYAHVFGWSALRSLRSEKYLYIQAPRRELYDEAADPGSEHNLASSSSAVADTLASQLQALRQKTSNTREAPKAPMDAAAAAKLGALGYMASSSEASRTPADQGPDPKDKIEIANMAHRAEKLQQDQHADEAIALLEQVIAKNPLASYYAKLGEWLVRKQDYGKAVPALRKALEMDPATSAPRFLLAKSLLATQEFDAAIPELKKLVVEVPNAVDVHSFLELAYARTNHAPEAIQECRIVLQYDPDDYGSYLILGQQLAVSGDTENGLETLKKAAAMEPRDPTPHLWLAEIYDRIGQSANAQKERSVAEQLKAPLTK